MIEKYSVQFERFDNDPAVLLCSSLKLSNHFCDYFPVTSAAGYIGYKELPGTPHQELWFCTIDAKTSIDACKQAFITLVSSPNLEKPFPLHLEVTYEHMPQEF